MDERRRRIIRAADTLRNRSGPASGGFRVVITGKGGVGKTTITALLAHIFARSGNHVLAVDEDPQENLAFSLGYPPERASQVVPLSKNIDYIEEKTGARPGVGWGMFLTLNPDVSDVVDRFGIRIAPGIDLLVMGSVIQAATGCLCPENALLESVIRFIRLRSGEVIFLDTQAGVEHFGRALAGGFSQAVVVSEPGFNALQVALHAAGLSRELGIRNIHLVVNKVRSDADIDKTGQIIGQDHPFSSVRYLRFDDEVVGCEPDVSPLLDGDNPFVSGLRDLASDLMAAERLR